MKKSSLIALLTMALILLAGCAPGEPQKAQAVDEIEGTWQRIGGQEELFCRLLPDETYVCDERLMLVEAGSGFKGQFWFEGGRYHDRTEAGPCLETGIYELYLQPNGNLKFVLVEDPCPARIAGSVGVGELEGVIEWERVP